MNVRLQFTDAQSEYQIFQVRCLGTYRIHTRKILGVCGALQDGIFFIRDTAFIGTLGNNI